MELLKNDVSLEMGPIMSRFTTLVCMAAATFAATGVRADAITWESTTNITMTANIEVEVPSGTTNYIGTLSGAYTLTKIGGGTLQQYTRDEAAAISESYGGKASGSVSKKTSYLLAGENTGSKYTKAVSLGIPILSEAEFMEMIRED